MIVGWCGEKVRLIPLDKPKHLPSLVIWLNDPAITAWMCRGDFPLTRLAEEEWFDAASKVDEKNVTFAIETLDAEFIGITGINNLDFRHGTGATGSLIGRRDLWGQGFGTDSIRVRTRYAFDVLGLRLLLSEVMDGNAGSLRALEKAGYQRTGRTPARWWKRGAYRDAISMAYLRGQA